MASNIATADFTASTSLSAFRELLRVLEAGPQCPCVVALRMSQPRRGLYPYLAELLGRDWITVIGGRELAGSHGTDNTLEEGPRDRRVAQLIAKTRQAIAGVAPTADPAVDLARKSRLWYEFFRAVDDDPPPDLYIAITRLGKTALVRLS